MCGIFAVIGSSQAAAELYIGLTHLQHRGQDAAGIAASDRSGGLRIFKGKGLALDIFSEETIRDLGGFMGIAHNRYPTAGVGDSTEYQPFSDGEVSIAFNGNIINYPSLKSAIEQQGRKFCSSSDGELLLCIFADAYRKGGFFHAVREVQEKLVGGYSVVGVVEGKGIFAFKDPNGIRPLIMGRRGGPDVGYAFASESIALSVDGYNSLRDLRNGEAVFVGSDLKIESKVIIGRDHAPCIFEYVYFSSVESVLNGMPVYSVRRGLGKALANKVKELWPDMGIDVVIPVPDTSRPAAVSLAQSLGVPYEEGLVKNRYIGRTFIMPSQKIRESALKVKLKPIESVIRGKNVMVVDDSIVRGTTSRRIVRLLRDFGARKVFLLSTFPPIRHPCVYGIDFTNENELIAHGKTIDDVEREIGADRLVYMDPDALGRIVGINGICMACLNGIYPTSMDHAREMQEQRLKDKGRMVEG
ncbi:amidophosphoribosyltransferase [Candidatus Woesearchaeota archaeon]|nr:amidophosphoribosyltransferase [Candidatus Woesearchaeota archaeon]